MITLWISQAGAGRRRARPVRRGRRRHVRSALLFLLPTDWENREFTLRWSDAAEIDWGTIILFGTGIILGSLISLGASFGLSVLAWPHLLGVDLYWVILPLAVILLLAAGSDYNLLLVSRFKEEIHAGINTGIIRSMAGTVRVRQRPVPQKFGSDGQRQLSLF